MASCPTPPASCFSYTNLLLWAIFLQENQMAAGAAGAPGRSAEQVPKKGGDSATILHHREEVPRAQGRACTPGPAEYLWMQAGEAVDTVIWPGYWVELIAAPRECNQERLISSYTHVCFSSSMNLTILSLYQGSKAASLFRGVATLYFSEPPFYLTRLGILNDKPATV